MLIVTDTLNKFLTDGSTEDPLNSFIDSQEQTEQTEQTDPLTSFVDSQEPVEQIGLIDPLNSFVDDQEDVIREDPLSYFVDNQENVAQTIQDIKQIQSDLRTEKPSGLYKWTAGLAESTASSFAQGLSIAGLAAGKTITQPIGELSLGSVWNNLIESNRELEPFFTDFHTDTFKEHIQGTTVDMVGQGLSIIVPGGAIGSEADEEYSECFD